MNVPMKPGIEWFFCDCKSNNQNKCKITFSWDKCVADILEAMLIVYLNVSAARFGVMSEVIYLFICMFSYLF